MHNLTLQQIADELRMLREKSRLDDAEIATLRKDFDTLQRAYGDTKPITYHSIQVACLAQMLREALAGHTVRNEDHRQRILAQIERTELTANQITETKQPTQLYLRVPTQYDDFPSL